MLIVKAYIRAERTIIDVQSVFFFYLSDSITIGKIMVLVDALCP